VRKTLRDYPPYVVDYLKFMKNRIVQGDESDILDRPDPEKFVAILNEVAKKEDAAVVVNEDQIRIIDDAAIKSGVMELEFFEMPPIVKEDS
jgi:hypothetical protein